MTNNPSKKDSPEGLFDCLNEPSTDICNAKNAPYSASSAHKAPYALQFLSDQASGKSTTKYFEGPLNQRSLYGDTPIPKKDQGKPAIKTSREKYAPNADKATTAAADPGLDINKAIQQVDPFGTAQVFAGMVKQFSMIRSTMNSASNSNPNLPNCPTLLKDAFYGALCLLSDKYSFDQVITAFNKVFSNNGFSQITPKYQSLVKESLINLIKDSIQYGVDDIPVSTLPVLIYGDRVPSPLQTTVPDLYCQVYYASKMDPYPGYMQWKNQTDDIIYTRRTETQLPYESSDQELVMISERVIANFLDIYIKNNNLTVTLLNTILAQEDEILKKNGVENNVGKNASNSTNLLSFLGALGTAVNLAQSLHLPNSVLNTSKINEAMGKFSQGMAMLQVMKNQSLPSLKQLNSLTGLNVPANLLAGLNLPPDLLNVPISALSQFGIPSEIINQIGSNAIGEAMSAVNIASNVVGQATNLIKNIGI